MWRRLSGIFSPGTYSTDYNHTSSSSRPSFSASPRPSRLNLHHGSSHQHGRGAIPEGSTTDEHSSDVGLSASATTGTTSEGAGKSTKGRSRSGTTTSLGASEQLHGQKDKENDMPPERRGTSGSRKSFDRFRRNHDSKHHVNSHELWMDSGKKATSESKEKDKKDSSTKNAADAAAGSSATPITPTFKPKSLSKSETIKQLQSTNAALTSQVSQLQAQLHTLEERDSITQSQYQVLEAEVTSLRKKAALDDEEIQSLLSNSTRATEAAARHIQDLDARNQGLEEQLRKMRERAQKAEAAAAAAGSQQLNGNGAAVGLVQVDGGVRAEEIFKSKADAYAGAEIIRMIETLNSEILQCAAFVAEAVMAADTKVKDEQRVIDKCRKRTGERVGQRLMEAMKRSVESGERDPFPLQLALQHAILVWSCYIVQAFTPENKDLNGQLASIWGKISMREEPAVAGKWRAIIAGQLRGPSTMYRAMYDDCKYLMVAGGWSTKSSNASTLSANIQARLMAVEASIMKVKEAVNEGVTSTEMVPCLANVGTPYDPSEMDSAYPDPSDQQMVQKPVVCTVDLGLKRLVATRLRDGSFSKKYEVLLKPKVILPTALDDGEVN